MLKKRITWLALGLIAALGVTVAAAPPLNLMPVYLWLGADKVSTANPLPVSGAGSSSSSPAYVANAPVATVTSLGSAVTGTGAQTAVQGRVPATAMVIGSTSAGTGAATVYIQVSNDNTNFITACTITLSLSTSVAADGCGIAVPWRYIRMNVNAISGTDASVTGTLGSQS